MRALSNLFLMGDTTIMRAYILALLVAMVGVQAISAAGLVDIPVRPFHWMSNITGGLVFGAGMVLAGGCSGSTWYRVGEGAVGAWVILLGFALGATTLRLGILGSLRATLQAPTIGDVPPTLATVLGISPWLVILAVWIVGGLWLFRSRPASASGQMVVASNRRRGGRAHRRRLVVVEPRRAPRGHHLRREHRRAPHLPAGGVPQSRQLEHGDAGGRARRRIPCRVARRRFSMEAAAGMVAGEDLRGRPPHGTAARSWAKDAISRRGSPTAPRSPWAAS